MTDLERTASQTDESLEDNLDHTIAQEREALRRAGSLNWAHWLVIGLSLLLTLGVWQYAQLQVDEKVRNRFENQSNQVVDLLLERLQKYEDTLWAGVAAMQSHSETMSNSEWAVFAKNLNIEEKYPGINGIGVIFPVADGDLESFLKRQRHQRPSFRIHPEHDNGTRLVITYIEPTATNAAAVGLDVAHEENRLMAALRARDSGSAQITGPIVLVQDAAHTPGFLFYAPWYKNNTGSATHSVDGLPAAKSSVETNRKHFAGMVYAPFVVNKLMEGTLSRQSRQVGISIRDGGSVLFDENKSGDIDFDDKPMFTSQIIIDVYGREWAIDVWASKAFRQNASSSQPILILVGGIVIDLMLIALFTLLVRTNRRAKIFTDHLSKSYQEKAAELQQSMARLKATNTELKHFAFAASHDLQEPLRTLISFTGILEKELGADHENQKVRQSLSFISSSSESMRNLLHGLMSYSNIGRQPELSQIDCGALVADAIANLQSVIDETGTKICIDQLPTIHGYANELSTLFLNLINNAIKFRKANEGSIISISCKESRGYWSFSVKDNGIGIEAKYLTHVFGIFKKLHSTSEYTGSGIGLANCKKVIDFHGGTISVESTYGVGSNFKFTIPKTIAPRA